jgi:hypothetical protein
MNRLLRNSVICDLAEEINRHEKVVINLEESIVRMKLRKRQKNNEISHLKCALENVQHTEEEN